MKLLLYIENMVSIIEHMAFLTREMCRENEALWYPEGGILNILIPFWNLGKKLNFSVSIQSIFVK